jgi:hypothetical protein
MYYVKDNHPAIIEREAFDQVQAELARRAKQYQPRRSVSEPFAFTGLIHCGRCGKRYRRKMVTNSKLPKPVWICPTFNTHGKSVCSSQQIPESILMAKTAQALGVATFDARLVAEHIKAIEVPTLNHLIFQLQDGRSVEVAWQNPSRRESWNEVMREVARQRQLARVQEQQAQTGKGVEQP